MAEIIRYCLTSEEHDDENVFKVCRPNIMGNPFTFLPKSKTKSKNLIRVKTRDEAVELYSPYFDAMVKKDKRFKAEFDRMFDAYLKYDVIYIGCFCHKDESCHGDIIAKKLKQRAVKQMLKNLEISKN